MLEALIAAYFFGCVAVAGLICEGLCRLESRAREG